MVVVGVEVLGVVLGGCFKAISPKQIMACSSKREVSYSYRTELGGCKCF